MNTPQKILPPLWVKRFFEWYCNPEVTEDLLGDMDELFYQNIAVMPVYRAHFKYAMQALTLAFSYAVRSRKRNFKRRHRGYRPWAMYQSYSKIAFRTMAKQKTFSIINIICLAVGMSVGLLALAAFTDVIEVDRAQINAGKIFRITTRIDDGSNKRTFASTSAPLAEKLKAEAQGIQEIVQLEKSFGPEVKQGPNTTIPLTGYYATANFFNVFTFPLKAGNSDHALEKPFSAVITQSTADKLFQEDESPLGKIIALEGLGDFEITGVVKDYDRSHLYFEILASYSTLALLERQGKREPSLDQWGPVTNHYTYLMLREGTAASDLDPVFHAVTETQFTNSRDHVQFALQQLTDIPMSDLYNEIGLSWGYMSLVVFFSLALLVLLPACFNYANIAIARALKRAKEIGLRKVSGGTRQHIFVQMVIETIIIALASLGGAVFIFQLIRRSFLDMIVQGTRTFDLEITPQVFMLFLLFAILTGFAAGILPAAYFARLNPLETLRNSTQSGKLSKISVRKGLIVAQFALSMIFILGVAITLNQYRYALQYDLGFTKENVLNIPLKDADQELLRTQWSQVPGVTGISMASSIPGNWSSSSVWVRKYNSPDSLEVFQMFVDPDYITTMEMELIAGNSFHFETPRQEEYIIVNETFLAKFNLGAPHEALGKSVIVDHGKELRITGVIKDFHYRPLQEQISSFFFRYDPAQFTVANVKFLPADLPQIVNRLESGWNKVSPQKFEPYFLDDQVKQSLSSYVSIIKIFGFLGGIAITISALGLLAVVISAAESRTREMGIRKVMGASVASLTVSLAKGFFKQVAISVMIAVPLTYLLFDKIFLSIFYYRASIGFAEIALSVAFLFVLVCLIIGSRVLKVARLNPVETLKTE